ncbi:hypothetical protein OV450_1378 [Actinobacteria bacterium OV450]|nr:hypothetical protein OV450_1378 [Actinobacteria bacterium OV450]
MAVTQTRAKTVRANSAARTGVVTIEAATLPGADALRITGWHAYDTTPEARIQGAIQANGLDLPDDAVTVRVHDHRNVSGTLDLAAACAILATAGHVDRDALASTVLIGELRCFDGRVTITHSAIDGARAAHAAGFRTVLVPAPQVHDVRALGLDLDVVGVHNVREAVALLNQGAAANTTI